MHNFKRWQIGLAMGWTDYKKAFDTLPHSWILKYLDMFRNTDNIKLFLEKSMNWETELMTGGERLGKVKMKHGIFQGDSLSPLLFVPSSLIPMSLVLHKVKAGYDLHKGSPKINHLSYMHDDLKLFGKTEKQFDSIIIMIILIIIYQFT